LLISIIMVLEERESCWTDMLIKLKMWGGKGYDIRLQAFG